jgi:putative PIN family toxin of toxin-antitoxin system
MKNVKNTDKLHVVLDTNVLVSAFSNPEGKLATLWLLARERKYQILISPFIVSEMARILRQRFYWKDHAIQERIRSLIHIAQLIIPRHIPDAVPTDPDDNHIIACALEGHADLIVSGDCDLLNLGEYKGIPIVRPADFLRTVNSPE